MIAISPTGRRGASRPLFVMLCAVLLMLGAGGARAQSAPAAPATAIEARDQQRVDAAAQAMSNGGAAALAPFLPDLEAARSHTPAGYRKIEPAAHQIGYRANNRAEFQEFAAWRAAQGTPEPKPVWLPNTYIWATFMLAWYYNDTHQPEKTLAILDRETVRSLNDERVAAEKGNALTQSRRFADAIAFYDQVLSGRDFMPAKARALLLRAKGFCLTEMKQYAAAEQAYRDSLNLEPDHQGAKNELAYIARVAGGGAPTAPVITTYDKSRQGQ